MVARCALPGAEVVGSNPTLATKSLPTPPTMKTTEAKVTQTILQQPMDITIGTKTYNVAPPSVATLILASEIVSRLPHEHLNEEKVIQETLSIAKDCHELGNLAAVLILGAKHVNDLVERRKTRKKRHLWGLFHTHEETVVIETAKEQLSRELLEEATPRDLNNSISQILFTMQVGDFFGLTTFLTEINLMRPTKVVTEPTASGQS